MEKRINEDIENRIAEQITESVNSSVSENNAIGENDGRSEEGIYVHSFRRNVSIDGAVVAEIRFDFDSLTGEDCIEIDRELSAEGEFVWLRAVHPVFLLKAASRASGVSEKSLKSLPIRDYNAITERAKRFFAPRD